MIKNQDLVDRLSAGNRQYVTAARSGGEEETEIKNFLAAIFGEKSAVTRHLFAAAVTPAGESLHVAPPNR